MHQKSWSAYIYTTHLISFTLSTHAQTDASSALNYLLPRLISPALATGQYQHSAIFYNGNPEVQAITLTSLQWKSFKHEEQLIIDISYNPMTVKDNKKNNLPAFEVSIYPHPTHAITITFFAAVLDKTEPKKPPNFLQLSQHLKSIHILHIPNTHRTSLLIGTKHPLLLEVITPEIPKDRIMLSFKAHKTQVSPTKS